MAVIVGFSVFEIFLMNLNHYVQSEKGSNATSVLLQHLVQLIKRPLNQTYNQLDENG